MDAEAAARASRAFSFLDGLPRGFFPGGSETSSMVSRVGAAPIGRAERIAGGRISIFGAGAAAEPPPRLRIGIGNAAGSFGAVRAAITADGKTFILNK